MAYCFCKNQRYLLQQKINEANMYPFRNSFQLTTNKSNLGCSKFHNFERRAFIIVLRNKSFILCDVESHMGFIS